MHLCSEKRWCVEFSYPHFFVIYKYKTDKVPHRRASEHALQSGYARACVYVFFGRAATSHVCLASLLGVSIH